MNHAAFNTCTPSTTDARVDAEGYHHGEVITLARVTLVAAVVVVETVDTYDMGYADMVEREAC